MFTAFDPCANTSSGCALQEFICVDCDKGGRYWPCLRDTIVNTTVPTAKKHKIGLTTYSPAGTTSQSTEAPLISTTSDVTPQTGVSIPASACPTPLCNVWLEVVLTALALIIIHNLIFAVLVRKGIAVVTCKLRSPCGSEGRSNVPSSDSTKTRNWQLYSNCQSVHYTNTCGTTVSTPDCAVANVNESDTSQSKGSVRRRGESLPSSTSQALHPTASKIPVYEEALDFPVSREHRISADETASASAIASRTSDITAHVSTACKLQLTGCSAAELAVSTMISPQEISNQSSDFDGMQTTSGRNSPKVASSEYEDVPIDTCRVPNVYERAKPSNKPVYENPIRQTPESRPQHANQYAAPLDFNTNTYTRLTAKGFDLHLAQGQTPSNTKPEEESDEVPPTKTPSTVAHVCKEEASDCLPIRQPFQVMPPVKESSLGSACVGGESTKHPHDHNKYEDVSAASTAAPVYEMPISKPSKGRPIAGNQYVAMDDVNIAIYTPLTTESHAAKTDSKILPYNTSHLLSNGQITPVVVPSCAETHGHSNCDAYEIADLAKKSAYEIPVRRSSESQLVQNQYADPLPFKLDIYTTPNRNMLTE